MSELFFIIFVIVIIVSLIYFVYNIMLGSENIQREEDLQITSNDILEQLSILYKQRKFNIVETLAKKYLEKKPSDYGVRTILAKTLYETGRKYEAIEHANYICRYQPKNFPMKIFIANCFNDNGKPMQAISVLTEVLNEDSNNVVAIKDLAKLYLETNQKKSAIKMFKKLDNFIYSNQEKVNNKNLIAKLHVEFREYEEAIEQYQEILEIYPADIAVKKNLVDAYKMDSDYESAIEITEEILSLNVNDETNIWATKLLIDLYSVINDYEKAMMYANMYKENPFSDQDKATENIAKILMDTGQINESIDVLKNLTEKNPKDTEIKKTLARAYESNNDFDCAIEIYKKILDEAGVEEIKEIHLNMSNLYSNWAMYLYHQGDTDACFKKFSLAVQYDVDNPQIYYKLGAVNQLIKNYNQSISQYKKAIELDPANAGYYYSISECYEVIGNVYEQKEALLNCVKYDIKNSKAYFKLAVLYDTQRDMASAATFLQKAVSIDDNYIEAKYKLALLLENQGEVDTAIEMYESILKIDPLNESATNNLKMLKS